jgi:hypothetical protein
MAIHEYDISTVASIPGRLTMLDHVLLAASVNSTDKELRGLAQWIQNANLVGRESAEGLPTSRTPTRSDAEPRVRSGRAAASPAPATPRGLRRENAPEPTTGLQLPVDLSAVPHSPSS